MKLSHSIETNYLFIILSYYSRPIILFFAISMVIMSVESLIFIIVGVLMGSQLFFSVTFGPYNITSKDIQSKSMITGAVTSFLLGRYIGPFYPFSLLNAKSISEKIMIIKLSITISGIFGLGSLLLFGSCFGLFLNSLSNSCLLHVVKAITGIKKTRTKFCYHYRYCRILLPFGICVSGFVILATPEISHYSVTILLLTLFVLVISAKNEEFGVLSYDSVISDVNNTVSWCFVSNSILTFSISHCKLCFCLVQFFLFDLIILLFIYLHGSFQMKRSCSVILILMFTHCPRMDGMMTIAV